MRFFIGAYTSKGAEGISHCEFDPANGSLGKPTLAAKSDDPSFLAIHPTRPLLYAVNEANSGKVSSFKINPASGDLDLLNQQSTHGAAPCHVSLDPAGRCAMVANYSTGNVAAFAVETDGRLSLATYIDQHHGHGPDPSRQEGPHAHCIVPDKTGRFAFSCDLGLDQILIYELDASAAKMWLHKPPFASTPPGSGPRHITFHPSAPFAYVVTEMASTLCVFRYDSTAGTLTPVQVISTLAPGFSGTTHAAEVCVHPSRPFLYVSNRGDDSITVFSVDPQTGELKYRSRQGVAGKNPRQFTFDPTGRFLLVANQDSNNITVFEVDASAGDISPCVAEIKTAAPVCVLFEHKKN